MKTALFGLRSHSSSKNPILVIDKLGLIGEALVLKLAKEFLVVFVSRKALAKENENIVYVSFLRRFPVIPDNQYSHIILIDEEFESKDFLAGLISKAKAVNAEFIFAQSVFSEKYAGDKILQLYSSAKIVIFGDIFDNKLILRQENIKSAINRFLYQAQRFGRIQIPGDGLKPAYPVFLPDVIDGLIDLVFGIHRVHSLFYLFPKYPPTELSLAHMIQKINPEIKVDFLKYEPRLKEITYPLGGQNLLDAKYPLAQKIRKIDLKKKVRAQDEVVLNRGRNKLRRLPIALGWTLISLLVFPLLFTLLFSFLGSGTLNYAKGEIDKNNFVQAKSSVHLSQVFFSAGKQTLKILYSQAKIVGTENALKGFSEDMDLGYRAAEDLSQAFNSGNYFFQVLSGKSKDPSADLAKGQGYLKNAVYALNRLRAEEKISAPISQNLETLNPLIKLLSATSDILPSILGMEAPRTYLILFQDNLELRPGGGLVNSYGVLKFDQGKITQFSMHDISEADSQLRGHAEPPFALRRYLPSTHWYMRDSNFDVDFSRAADDSANFFLVETGQKADGVFAVDNTLIKNILSAIGPVDTNNHFSSKSLNQAIIAKIAQEKVSYLLIAQAVSDGLMQKHLLLTFKDEQNIFTVNGWSSALWDERVNSEKSLNDFVGINEANLGLNKINDSIERQVGQKVTITDKDVTEELIIKYKNGNKTGTNGDYKNYLRIILPKNTSLLEISINDQPQKIINAITDSLIYEAKNFKAPQGLEVEKTQENNKTIFGFLVKIPAGQITQIKLKYTLAGNIAGLNTFSYSLKLFKQPGIDSLPYNFSLTYPDSFTVVKSSAGITRGEGEAGFSEKIRGDKNLMIDFAKR